MGLVACFAAHARAPEDMDEQPNGTVQAIRGPDAPGVPTVPAQDPPVTNPRETSTIADSSCEGGATSTITAGVDTTPLQLCGEGGGALTSVGTPPPGAVSCRVASLKPLVHPAGAKVPVGVAQHVLQIFLHDPDRPKGSSPKRKGRSKRKKMGRPYGSRTIQPKTLVVEKSPEKGEEGDVLLSDEELRGLMSDEFPDLDQAPATKKKSYDHVGPELPSPDLWSSMENGELFQEMSWLDDWFWKFTLHERMSIVTLETREPNRTEALWAHLDGSSRAKFEPPHKKLKGPAGC